MFAVYSGEPIINNTSQLPRIIHALQWIAREKFINLCETILTLWVLLTSEKSCQVTKKSVICCTIILAPNFTYCLENDTKEHLNKPVFFFFSHQEELYTDK